jgi:hypothetical protein
MPEGSHYQEIESGYFPLARMSNKGEKRKKQKIACELLWMQSRIS